VQQFLEALGMTTPPAVSISQTLVLLRGEPGARLTHSLVVNTSEKRVVYALARSSAAWLEVGPVTLDGRRAHVPLVVPSVPAESGGALEAWVEVTANGGRQFTVAVHLDIQGQGEAKRNTPRPARFIPINPRPLDWRKQPPPYRRG
jgi:hypothetical protein